MELVELLYWTSNLSLSLLNQDNISWDCGGLLLSKGKDPKRRAPQISVKTQKWLERTGNPQNFWLSVQKEKKTFLVFWNGNNEDEWVPKLPLGLLDHSFNT
ncbi:hypothetical protein SCA6_001452 [Theobroma cacao]